jgi:flagellar basal-body rod protein FlgB
MTMISLTGMVGSVLHTTLDGLSARHRAIADNVANIQTPGFLAKRVHFEDSLSTALATGAGPEVEASESFSEEPTRLDGNNVNLEQETMLDAETSLRYTMMLRAVDDRFGLVRTAVRGG